MQEEHTPVLYLSRSKSYLADEYNNILFTKQLRDGKTYYIPSGIESEAYEKVAQETRPMKVCISWNKDHTCEQWAEVDVCTRSELIPRGFSNIS